MAELSRVTSLAFLTPHSPIRKRFRCCGLGYQNFCLALLVSLSEDTSGEAGQLQSVIQQLTPPPAQKT